MGTNLNKQAHSTNDLASGGFAVTPNDSANLSSIAYGLFTGGSGNLKIDCIDGTTITLNGLSAGQFVPVIAVKVYATGTTATNIIGFL